MNKLLDLIKNGPKNGKPELASWTDLARVCMSVDVIIEDGYTQGGLFGRNSWSLLSTAPSGEELPMPSRLAVYLAGPNGNLYSSVVEALPGIEKAGATRSERLAVLMARLPELPAYAWLMAQPSYRDDVKGKLRGGQLPPSYHTETAELGLLEALATPFGQFFSATQFADADYLPKYPTRDEVKAATKAAQKLQAFLKGNSALMIADEVNWQATFSVDALLNDLTRLERGYKRPADSFKALQTLTVHRLIVETAKKFGRPSPALLVDLAAIIDYPTDAPNMSKRIADTMQGCTEAA